MGEQYRFGQHYPRGDNQSTRNGDRQRRSDDRWRDREPNSPYNPSGEDNGGSGGSGDSSGSGGWGNS